MRRNGSVSAKVKDRRHEWRMKVPEPDVVDGDPCGEWILAGGDPLRQGTAATSARLRIGLADAGEGRRERGIGQGRLCLDQCIACRLKAFAGRFKLLGSRGVAGGFRFSSREGQILGGDIGFGLLQRRLPRDGAEGLLD